MVQLNQISTEIFCQLIAKLNDGQEHIKLTASQFMPLVIEQLATGIGTPKGKAVYYSLCHYYLQEGDLMRDPEMCFLVVDNRTEPKDFQNVHIFPQLFQQDNTGTSKECVRMENGRATQFHRRIQQELCEFAAVWMENIRQQGFLNEQDV